MDVMGLWVGIRVGIELCVFGMYIEIMWTFGVWDSARPGVETIRRRVREKLCPGAIILLHDGDGYDPTGADARGDRRETSLALPGIIQDARDAGYEFRPLGELCA